MFQHVTFEMPHQSSFDTKQNFQLEKIQKQLRSVRSTKYGVWTRWWKTAACGDYYKGSFIPWSCRYMHFTSEAFVVDDESCDIHMNTIVTGIWLHTSCWNLDFRFFGKLLKWKELNQLNNISNLAENEVWSQDVIRRLCILQEDCQLWYEKCTNASCTSPAYCLGELPNCDTMLTGV